MWELTKLSEPQIDSGTCAMSLTPSDYQGNAAWLFLPTWAQLHSLLHPLTALTPSPKASAARIYRGPDKVCRLNQSRGCFPVPKLLLTFWQQFWNFFTHNPTSCITSACPSRRVSPFAETASLWYHVLPTFPSPTSSLHSHPTLSLFPSSIPLLYPCSWASIVQMLPCFLHFCLPEESHFPLKFASLVMPSGYDALLVYHVSSNKVVKRSPRVMKRDFRALGW